MITLFDKQTDVFKATERIICYVGGIQCGKSLVGGLWITQKLVENRRADDNFIITAPEYKTMFQATIPAFMQWARPYGSYNQNKATFITHWGSTVYFRTGTNPESIEGIRNVKAIWNDEAGQLSRYFWENIMGRAAFAQGQIINTTTPYSNNWLASIIEDARTGKRNDVKVVQLRSIDSPYFPPEEYQRQQALLDPRRFAMKYMGQFGDMQGLVYDNYRSCLILSKLLPKTAVYYGGVDWGFYPDPFALITRAVVDGVHYRVDEFYRNGLTILDIGNIIMQRNKIFNYKTLFCDPSQPAHIEHLNRINIPSIKSNNDIRYGIDRHYALMKDQKFFIFEDMCPIGIDEYATYHYPAEKELKYDDGSKELLPVDKHNHGLDCDRYITSMLSDILSDKRDIKVCGEEIEEPKKDIYARSKWLRKTNQYSGL